MHAIIKRQRVARLALSVFLLALVSACASSPGADTDAADAGDVAEPVLSGELVYRQRIALPPNAVIQLRLIDSDQDSIVAQKVIHTDGRQVPITFALQHAAADFVAQNHHELLITVRDGAGQLLWAANESIGDGNAQDLRIRLAQAHTDRDTLIGTYWKLQRIEHADGAIDWARDNKPSSIVFDAEGNFHGKAACNNFFGSYQLHNDGTLQMGHAGATLMACMNPNIAPAFLQTLARVDSYVITRRQLRLTSDNAVLVLERDLVD